VARSATGANGGVFERFGYFEPKHLDLGSSLYRDLHNTSEMRSFGVNLAESAQKAFSGGLGKAFPFIVLVLGVTATSYYQQRQIAGRNPAAAAANPQQQMLMKIMPLFFAFISLTLPAGIVVYFLVSNVFRIGQQAFITHTMYPAGADGPVATTGTAIDSSSPEKPKGILAQFKEMSLPSPSQAKEDFRNQKASGSKAVATKDGGAASRKRAATTTTTKPSAPSRKAAGPSRAAPQNANRSQKKKKRK
jgi:membrane protein insertase Oxa1/YidC/SpoIIIJ